MKTKSELGEILLSRDPTKMKLSGEENGNLMENK